ncbi:mitochondrial 2-oxoglutarate/malate carrier protein-like isoform X2 [Plodia interpunctella]|nr:mitochondrial 2-oxoglutarate/malate carrier protein-like isoform X2 [Plodia interpunctella]
MQLEPKIAGDGGLKSLIIRIVAKDGVFGLYAGISAALFRQATYTTARFGIFNLMFDYYRDKYGMPGFGTKLALGLISGGLSAFVGNPGEVVLVRMTADGQLPPDQRRNYTNVIDAISRMIREEGVSALWRGTMSTVVRAMIVNASQLSTYVQAREMLQPKIGEGLLLHVLASMVAGLVSSVASLPIDIVKTRVQNAREGTSEWSIFLNIIKYEGPLALWHGFIPTFAKIAPHTVLTFVFFEKLVTLYHMMDSRTAKR